MGASFTVQRSALVRELSLAIGSVERKTTIPILSNVRLEADESRGLSITATDLELGIQCRCDAEVRAGGATTLPAKRLLDYVRLLPDGPVEFSVGDSEWTSIKAGRARTRIAGMSVESFPQCPPRPAAECAIPLAGLALLIRRTSYAISAEESRFTLNGALLEIRDGIVRMVTTDGHRLALAECSITDQPARANVLVPKKALAEIAKLAGASAADAVAEFSTDDNHLFFAVGDRVLTARKLSGNFPDYARILPKAPTGSATVSRVVLKEAISRVASFADDRSRSMRLMVADGQISAAASDVTLGESEESVDAETSGSLLTGFNAGYPLDFLGSVDCERVKLSFAAANAAVSWEPIGEAARCVAVIMPMRV